MSPEHGLLVFGTLSGTLDAVSIRDGRLAFSIRASDGVATQPLIAGDRVYFGEGLHEANHARLVAARLPDGQPLWQRGFEGHVEVTPRLSEGILYGCAGQAGVFAVRASDGKLLWQAKAGHCDSTPWLEGASLYVLVEARPHFSALLALDAASGATHWNLELPGEPWGNVLRTGELLTFTTGEGQLGPQFVAGERGWAHAVDPVARQIAWTRELPAMPLPDGLFLSGLSIHALKTGEILGLRVPDGSIAWKIPGRAPLLTNPRVIPGGETLTVELYDGRILEVDSATGKLMNELRVEDQATSAPAFSATHAYFGSRSSIVAIPVREGRLAP